MNETSDRAVVGALIVYPELADMVIGGMPREDLECPLCQRVFDQVAKRHRAGQTWDLALLAQAGLRPSLLAELAEVAPSPALVGAHVRAVRLGAMRRRAVFAAKELLEQAANPDSDPEVLVAEAVSKLQACHIDTEEFHHISTFLTPWLEAVKANLQTPQAERRGRGIPTGLARLNQILTFSGLPRGHMTVVAAQSGGGKTAFANSALALPAALLGYSVGVCSLEDGGISVAVRDIANMTNMPNRQLQREEVGNVVEWQEVCQQAETLAATEIWVYDTPPPSVDALCARIVRHCSERPCDLMIVDFLQYVPSGRKVGNKTEREEYTMRALALMARRLKETATVVLSQYRDIPPEQRPTDNDIRGAKVARHFAHTILHVHEVAKQVEAKRKTIIVSKQKQGPIGDIEVGWEKTRVRFFDAP